MASMRADCLFQETRAVLQDHPAIIKAIEQLDERRARTTISA